MKPILFFLWILAIPCSVFCQEIAPTRIDSITTNGVKIYYEEFGIGEPLLLLHYFQSTGRESWSPFIEEFSKSYKLIIPDLRGHGKSTDLNTMEPYAIEPVADDLITLLDSLDIKKIKGIGSSVGGAVLFSMSAKRPDLITDMVTIGGVVFRPVKFREWVKENPDTGASEHLIALHGEEKAHKLVWQFNNLVDFYGDHQLTPDVLAKIETRTLIVHSDKDPIVPVEHAWLIYESIPNGNLWIVPHYSHVPHMYPENQEDFKRRVLSFLKEK